MLHEPIDSSCRTSKLHGKVPIKHLHWLSMFVLVRCREDLTLSGAGGEKSAASLSPRRPRLPCVLLGAHASFSLAVSEGKARGLLYLGRCQYVGITKLLCLTLLTEISAIAVYL